MNRIKTKQILILLISTLIVSLITIFIDNTYVSAFDSWFYEGVAKYINSNMTVVMKVITYSGGTIALLTLTLVLFAFKETRKKWAIPISCSLVVAAIINNVIKILIARERPDILRMIEMHDYSFPSGHSMNNMAYYSMILLLTWKYIKNIKWKWLLSIVCIVMPLSIGISRIYLGVHYATDVVVGWILGFAIAYLIYQLFFKGKQEQI